MVNGVIGDIRATGRTLMSRMRRISCAGKSPLKGTKDCQGILRCLCRYTVGSLPPDRMMR